jgi:hypothetical protein
MKQQNNFNYETSKRQVKREAAFTNLVYSTGFVVLFGLFAWLVSQLL